ncbi:MAG TPA: insulinase family protein [Candidatus Gallibacteroides avistercoris]|uniref:Insulinase family protein n=1 Tax=Candidatus Gallibacteroides avistercoris TaxID=2840833 RepID=A0A9D1SCG7_9BACT|nr:insulinase family protein [Candidatus Gallibacteroides avistercoris]
MYCQTYTLPNGLRMIHLPVPGSVSYCGFTVNAGTRDEFSREYGMAHFVEHMLFKGTHRRKAWHILNRMESVGGELNAFTTKEETVVYSIFLNTHFERAVELLGDLVFNSRFPEAEMEKEREVILDEINSYKDNPAELIYDEFENLLFDGHEIGHLILGTTETLQRFTSADGRSFVNRLYTPSNMVFFSTGSVEFSKIVRWGEKYLGGIASDTAVSAREKPGRYQPVRRTEQMDTFQAHVIIGNRAYDLYDDKRYAMVLLNNILGGPCMNSRLNLALRERHGYVYTVESTFTPYSDTGVFSIYFGTDPQKVDRCVALVYKVLSDIRKNSLSSMQLSSAKKQMIGQVCVDTDNHENVALGLGKSFLRFGRYSSVQEVCRKIEAITSSDILEVANEVLDEASLSLLSFQ